MFLLENWLFTMARLPEILAVCLLGMKHSMLRLLLLDALDTQSAGPPCDGVL